MLVKPLTRLQVFRCLDTLAARKTVHSLRTDHVLIAATPHVVAVLP